tara:strand:+ start:402 stop:740 length:339 start_codon:yes stop_codon:yes gene_type:complete
MSTNVISLAIGIGILGIGGEMILNGKLKNDTSMVGRVVKIVIILVGLAFVILPIKAMFGSRDQQRQWRKQLGRGVRRSGQTLRDEFGTASRTIRTVARETGGAVRGAIGYDD